MFKKRKRLLSGALITGLMALNCFCCLIFRTRFPMSTFFEPSTFAASLKGMALPASWVTNLPISLITQLFLGFAH